MPICDVCSIDQTSLCTARKQYIGERIAHHIILYGEVKMFVHFVCVSVRGFFFRMTTVVFSEDFTNWLVLDFLVTLWNM